MHASELWHSKSTEARLARAVLTPVSWLYALGWESYLACYSVGLKKPVEPHRRVVCIGNLQVGGSGKTPVTRFVARKLRDMGYEVVVSCSGYGSPHSAEASIAPEGELDPAYWGDEPAMLRWLEPDFPLIVGRNRVRAAELAHSSFPDAVLLLDDGFQHLPLKKHATILLDPEHPDNSRCLPAGPYREPRSNRARADLVVPGRFKIERAPMELRTPAGDPVSPSEYAVLCAIGSPLAFLQDLGNDFPNAARGLPPRLLPDHDPLDAGTLLNEFPQNLPIVVTAKDWVKLRARNDAQRYTFLIASHDVRLEPVQEFQSWLRCELVQGEPPKGP